MVSKVPRTEDRGNYFARAVDIRRPHSPADEECLQVRRVRVACLPTNVARNPLM